MTELQKIMDLFPSEEFLKADGYDDCVIGVTPDLRLIYDRDLVIEKLRQELSDGASELGEEAVEFFDYNIAGAYVGPKTPLYVSL